MNRRDFLKRVGFGVVMAAFGGCAKVVEGAAGDKLNVVFIMADDLGWRDVGFMGSKFYETPNIDRLASQGMIFENAYTCGPNCAPTRASLISGQYTPRHNILSVGRADKAPVGLMKLLVDPIDRTLKSSVVSIAEALKPAGYTSISIGKWHLGKDPLLGPQGQGFDYNVGGNETGQPKGGYFSPYKNPQVANGPDGEYLTDRLTDEAIKFIDANKREPFFLYLPHYAVHTPLQAKQALIKKYKNKTPVDEQKNVTYAAMIESVDRGVGKIMDKLDQLNLTDKTVVFFYSDNGGYKGATSNKPLRGYKGQLYEGGVRVPLAVRWPGVVKPGSRCSVPVISVDFYPTLVQIAGCDLPKGQSFDGESILPLLKGESKLNRDELYWHFPCYLAESGNKAIRQAPAGSIRKGNWKLIEFFEDNHLELYDLQKDPYEQNNVAASVPSKADELHQQLVAWRKSVRAKVPTKLNPKYDK